MLQDLIKQSHEDFTVFIEENYPKELWGVINFLPIIDKFLPRFATDIALSMAKEVKLNYKQYAADPSSTDIVDGGKTIGYGYAKLDLDANIKSFMGLDI